MKRLIFCHGAVMLVGMSVISLSEAYIVSSPGTGLPLHRQVRLLEDMTSEICDTQPGTLSIDMLEQSHELMYAWSHLNRPSVDCALKAESLLKRVVEEHKINTESALPTLNDYNCLLEGWARSKVGPAAPERCEQIIQEMENLSYILPDLDSFKSVLMAWREVSDVAPHAPLRAHRMLEWMIRLHASGENPDVCPDADCFDVVMQLYAKSNLSGAAKETERLLGVMEQLYEKTQNPRVKPRTTSFNTVLTAWSKSNDPNAGDRAIELLSFMDKLSKTDQSIKVDRFSFQAAINSLKNNAQSPKAANKATWILDYLERGFLAGNADLAPTTVHFNTVLACLSKTKSWNGAYRRARSLLVHQQQFSAEHGIARPDVYGFTSVLATCAMEPKQKDKAFQVAMQTLQQLRHNEDLFGAPNHVTYGTMLKCCARLLPARSPERIKFARKIFGMCIQDGCAGDMVLSRLREAAGCADVYQELLGKGHTKHNLPESWTRNVSMQDDRARLKAKSKGKPKRRFAEV